MAKQTQAQGAGATFDEKRFRAFQCSRTSLKTYRNVMIVLTIFLAQDIITAYMVRFSYLKIFLCLFVTLLFFVGWALYYLKYYIEYVGNEISQENINKVDPPFVISICKIFLGTNKNNLINAMHIFEDMNLDMVSITAGLLVIYRSAYGDCGDLHILLTTATCNPENACGFLPSDITALCLLVPLTNKVLFKGTSWNAKLRSMFITLSMVLYSIIATQSWQSLYFIALIFPFTLLMLFELRRQNIEVFMLTESLQLSLEENEKLAEEMRLHEMKMMIGNIAHDLKTPLTAFFSGLDEITMMGKELKSRIQQLFHKLKRSAKKQHNRHHSNHTNISNNSSNSNGNGNVSHNGYDGIAASTDHHHPLPPHPTTITIPLHDENNTTHEYDSSSSPNRNNNHYNNMDPSVWLELKHTVFNMVDNIHRSIDTAKGINSFMLMSINRCIDFTKVRHGVSLKPKMETFCLLDVLNVPLNCMRDLQEVIEIKSFPLPTTLCSHVITDRQWFQENLLCLISNSVKYSNKGVVTIKIFPWMPSVSEKDMLRIKKFQSNSKKESPVHFITTSTSSISNIDSTRSVTSSNNSSNSSNTSTAKTLATSGATNSINLNVPSMKQQSDSDRSYGLYANTHNNAATSTATATVMSSRSSTAFSPPDSTKAVGATVVTAKNRQELNAAVSATTSSTVSNINSNNHDNGVVAGASNKTTPVGLKRQRKSGNSYTGFLQSDMSQETHVRIEVEDQGIGIAREVMDNLFAPFKQAQRFAGGTGLGLFSLAKRVEALNGLYGAEARRDGESGSVFWFSFPYQPDKASAKLYKTEVNTKLKKKSEEDSCFDNKSRSSIRGGDHDEDEFHSSRASSPILSSKHMVGHRSGFGSPTTNGSSGSSAASSIHGVDTVSDVGVTSTSRRQSHVQSNYTSASVSPNRTGYSTPLELHSQHPNHHHHSSSSQNQLSPKSYHRNSNNTDGSSNKNNGYSSKSLQTQSIFEQDENIDNDCKNDSDDSNLLNTNNNCSQNSLHHSSLLLSAVIPHSSNINKKIDEMIQVESFVEEISSSLFHIDGNNNNNHHHHHNGAADIHIPFDNHSNDDISQKSSNQHHSPYHPNINHGLEELKRNILAVSEDEYDDDDDDDDDDDSDEDEEKEEEEKPKFSSLNILLVDDSVPIRKVLTSMLKGQGHSVVTANNGAESLDRLAEQQANCNGMPFDVILMDMQMPVMDGLEATRRIRSMDAIRRTTVNPDNTESIIFPITGTSNDTNNSNITTHTTIDSYQKILALSANSDDDTIADAFKVGVDEFMPKPFTIKSLYDKLHIIHEKRKLMK